MLFSLSGAAFMAKVAPLQRELRAMAADGARSGSFDVDAYTTLSKRWESWGALALGTPLAALVLMVLKPF